MRSEPFLGPDRQTRRERQRQAAVDVCEALAVDNVFVTMALLNNSPVHPVLQADIAQSRHAFPLAKSPYITQSAAKSAH